MLVKLYRCWQLHLNFYMRWHLQLTFFTGADRYNWLFPFTVDFSIYIWPFLQALTVTVDFIHLQSTFFTGADSYSRLFLTVCVVHLSHLSPSTSTIIYYFLFFHITERDNVQKKKKNPNKQVFAASRRSPRSLHGCGAFHQKTYIGKKLTKKKPKQQQQQQQKPLNTFPNFS